MKKVDSKLIATVAKGCLKIALIVAICRLTKGAGTAVLVLIAAAAAASGRLAVALSSYALCSFMVIMSSYILPKAGLTGVVLRFAPILVTMGLLIQCGKRRGNNSLPIGLLWLYIFVAIFSSAFGYCPMVSYMKLFNFAIMLLGLHVGLRNIDRKPVELENVRMFILSLITFMVVGSVMTLATPGIAYSTSLNAKIDAEGLEAAADAAKEITQDGGMLLFAGLTCQSQALGIMIPNALAWLLCDMLFVERRLTPVHVVTILACFPMLYMCRSRTAFVAACFAIAMVGGYCIHRVKMPLRVRVAMKHVFRVGVVLVLGACVFLEVRNHGISRFLRKYDDAASGKSFTESFTETRMGKVEENMADFKTNPLIGTGFQVSFYMKGLKGFRLSAPVEKSVLPTMVLGETGVFGGIAFFAFLCAFYSTCIRKKYFCTLTMMTTFLATNLSEATFFSPGGVGGVMWVFCCVGGFVNDMVIKNRRQVTPLKPIRRW